MQVSPPSQVISGEFFKSNIRNPIVYAWVRNGIYFYIGKSINGYGRIISHNIIGKADELLDTDKIIIWFTTKEEINKLEEFLIDLYIPKYNKKIEFNPKLKFKKCSLCNQRFETSDKNKKHCDSCRKRIEYITNGTIKV